jgi:hypothetical protein
MSPAPDQRTVAELVSDAVNQFTKLMRNEVAIARTELTTKAIEAALGIGLLVGGALLLIPAMVLLLMALAAWLSELGLSNSVSNLIAGVLGLAISGGVGFVGKSKLTPENLTPNRAISEFERDVAAVKETHR